MAYTDEDEIDWSDGPLNPPSPEDIKSVASPSRFSPIEEAYDDYDSLFVDHTQEQNTEPNGLPLDSGNDLLIPCERNTVQEGMPYSIPQGLPLGSALSVSNDAGPTRVQRARTGVRLNHRLPSKQDYSNFALYQASQKAYEATFLKNFVAHALRPDQIAECSEEGTDSHATLPQYLDSVSQQVSKITEKMIWNAHCRVVNLFANDGKNGAPFLNVRDFNPEIFSSFGPGNTFLVANKMDASWHRAGPDPSMVRYSTAEYPLLHHVGPLEEIDEVTNTLLRKDRFGKTLPTGRPAKLPTAKKPKGQGMPGAAVREQRETAPRGNWLAFPHYTKVRSPSPKFFEPHDPTNDVEILDAHHEPRVLEDLRNMQDVNSTVPTSAQQPAFHERRTETVRSLSPQFEELFGSYGTGNADIYDIDESMQGNSLEHVEKVPSWRARLVNDHRRRLTQKWGDPPQIFNTAFDGFKQALAVARAKGVLPVGNDYRKKLPIIEARERQQRSIPTRSPEHDFLVSENTREPANRASNDHSIDGPAETPEKLLRETIEKVDPPRRIAHPLSEQGIKNTRQHKGKCKAVATIKSSQRLPTGPPKKKIKMAPAAFKQATKKQTTRQKITKSPKQDSNLSSPKTPVGLGPLPPHPSGSTTLELHQQLPPEAFFEPTTTDQKTAWRCGIKHAMGHYYNAGDRKNCRGCNTSLSDNTKAMWMDFYMPSRTFYYQPAPGIDWRPFKPSDKGRKSSHPCHNSVAKDAYWAGINTGTTQDEARQMGINAVIEYLKPKPPPKEPTPAPSPTPAPHLGPHPSGSTTMEHGQELPDSAYWTKQARHEELAWRCDVNHAFGRYYLAGDKKSCPGCGSSKTGQGKRVEMDFFLPPGVVVRQEAPGLSVWKPRKPNKSEKAGTAKSAVTHNQMCSRVYWEVLGEGLESEEALRYAVERVDEELDQRQEKKREELEANENPKVAEETDTEVSYSRNDSANSNTAGSLKSRHYRANSRGGCTVSLFPKKRDIDDLFEDGGEAYESGDAQSVRSSRDVLEVSSADEESSGSESE